MDPYSNPFWIKKAGDYPFYVSQSTTGVEYNIYCKSSSDQPWELLNDETEIYPTACEVGGYSQWYIEKREAEEIASEVNIKTFNPFLFL